MLVAGRVGYTMAVDREVVDVHRFERQVHAARRLIGDGATAQGASALRAALDVWRGEPLQGTELYGWGAAEIARLNEARLRAAEDFWETQLRLGRARGRGRRARTPGRHVPGPRAPRRPADARPVPVGRC
jgi:hypothetical protein